MSAGVSSRSAMIASLPSVTRVSEPSVIRVSPGLAIVPTLKKTQIRDQSPEASAVHVMSSRVMSLGSVASAGHWKRRPPVQQFPHASYRHK